MSVSTPLLGAILASFFNDHLKLRKGLRPNSITSYADAMRLFLQFTAKTAGKKITQLNKEPNSHQVNTIVEVICSQDDIEKTRKKKN